MEIHGLLRDVEVMIGAIQFELRLGVVLNLVRLEHADYFILRYNMLRRSVGYVQGGLKLVGSGSVERNSRTALNKS